MAALVGGARTVPQPPAQTDPTTLERFRRMKPSMYDGIADTDLAERFLDECEKILVTMEVVEAITRITLTAFQLVGRASAWWASIKESGGTEGLSWERFKERFRDHFFPQSLKDAKREGFLNLIQRTMSVLDYERRFTDLSKYALKLISTPHLKCRRFERGLRPMLRGKMVPLGLENYELLINRAMTVERDVIETKSIFEGRRGKSVRGQSEGESGKRFKPSSSAPQAQQSSQGSMTPKQPRRAEGGPQRQIICYNYRQPGHRSNECPQKLRSTESVGQARSGHTTNTRIC